MLRNLLLLLLLAIAPSWATEYRVLATSRTSTMEKELNAAAAEGFVFTAVMGGETAAGKEVVVTMSKDPDSSEKRVYRLLATSKTSTMQRELQALGDQGFRYLGQTVFETAFGGKEVVVLLEQRPSQPARIEYLLLATKRTSTLQKELDEAGRQGYLLLGLSVGQTSLAGNEILCILRKP